MNVLVLAVTETCASTQPEERCPRCRRLLYRGVLVGEIQCPKCGWLVRMGGRVS